MNRPRCTSSSESRQTQPSFATRIAIYPVRGTYWIDPASGRVLQTSLQLADPRTARRPNDREVQPERQFDVLVPLEMRERYTSASGEEVTTVATYSDFRRFEATSRLK